MDTVEFFRDFVDFAGPKLDTYEQAIYLHLVRHSRFKDIGEYVMPVESASLRLAIGIAKKGARISRGVIRRKLQSLQEKGFVRIIAKEYRGTRIAPLLPCEVVGVVPPAAIMAKMDLETFDFYSEPSGREAIFARENGKCFYCLALLNDRNRVIDHILPVACGDNTYRNCVAACLSCNSEKGETSGEEFLRVLCRKGRLSAEEFDSRYRLLQSIQIGLEKPEL